MDNECKLKILKYGSRNHPVSVLITVSRSRTLGNVCIICISFGVILCSTLCYKHQDFGLMDLLFYSIFASLSIFCMYWCLSFIKEESLSLTVPLSLHYVCTSTFGKRSIFYIPWKDVKDFAVIEVISGHKVLYYLALLLRDTMGKNDQHIILFNETTPRLHHLQVIYKEVQKLVDGSR